MRSIWTGYIAFGLVNIPVKLYSAISRESELSFDLLHRTDQSPIRYARFCKKEEKEVPYEEIIKGYALPSGDYVEISDEDFERANPRLSKTISILDFVDEKEIDSRYYYKPYYLAPDKEAKLPYSLFAKALAVSKKTGIGKFVLRNREHLVMLKTDDEKLILEQLYFANQLKPIDELPVTQQDINERELELALNLINMATRDFKIENYTDTYTEVLKKVIKSKAEGMEAQTRELLPSGTRTTDLLAKLQESLKKAERQKVEK